MRVRIDRRSFVIDCAAIGVLSLFGPGPAGAQPAAARPIRLVVGLSAGGAIDSLARSFGRQLEEAVRASVIVDNRPGAAGSLAVANVGNAAADGTTLLIASVGEIAITPNLLSKIPFDPARLVPVSELVVGSMTFVVGSQVPVKSMAEYLQWSQGKSPFLLGTTGPGSPHHLLAVMMAESLKRKVEPVHYRQIGDLLSGLISGELHGAFVPTTLANAWQQAGKVTALAVSSPLRSPILPGIPTLREVGLQAAEFDGWIGVFAPPGTTREVADRLHASFAVAARAPDVKATMDLMGFTARATRRDEFERVVMSDRARYAKVIESSGLKAD